MTTVWGVDGCRGGWACVAIDAEGAIAPVVTFLETVAPLIASGDVVAIDIPMGLPDRIEGAGRVAEQAARAILRGRTSSVFSMPARAAVYAKDYAAACREASAVSDPPRKVSKQAFMIFDKIRELDALLTPDNQGRVFESHAEVAFWKLHGEAPLRSAKSASGAGLAERIGLLRAHGFPDNAFAMLPKRVPIVDAVDAAAIALVARRCARGEGTPFPDPPGVDGRGLRIAIWA